MIVELNGFRVDLSLLALRDASWIELPLSKSDRGFDAKLHGIDAKLTLDRADDRGFDDYRGLAKRTAQVRQRLE